MKRLSRRSGTRASTCAPARRVICLAAAFSMHASRSSRSQTRSTGARSIGAGAKRTDTGMENSRGKPRDPARENDVNALSITSRCADFGIKPRAPRSSGVHVVAADPASPRTSDARTASRLSNGICQKQPTAITGNRKSQYSARAVYVTAALSVLLRTPGRIVSTLSRQLEIEFGRSFGGKSLAT